ncbi:hypothetical protein MUP32_05350 [Candidatus Microgenomates bacterium]|nr:hypothetical protein [Candidatus Microgenomates bacterium]
MKKMIAGFSSLSLVLFSKVTAFAATEEIPINIPTPSNLKTGDLGKLVSGAVGLVLVLAALATFIYLLIAGVEWIISGGDKAKVEAAQNKIQAAILGLFIVFAAWGLMIVVEQFFGISILRGIKLPSGY